MDSQIYQIRPNSPFDAEYPLSKCDLQLPVRFIRKAVVYATDGNISSSSKEGQDLISRLQESLKSIIQELNPDTFTYPQLLGRVIRSAEGGSLYVKVEKSSTIQMNVMNRPDIAFEGLQRNGKFPMETITTGTFGVGLDKESLIKWPDGPPNLAIQLTFIRGGFVLLLAFGHQICDAYAIGGLVKRWFRKARLGSAAGPEHENGSLSTLAIHDKTVLSRSDVKGSTHGVKKLQALYENPLSSDTWLPTSSKAVSRVFWIPPHKIEELRATVGENSSQPPTLYESLLTVLWRCIMRTRLTPETETSSALSKAIMIMDMRKRLEPPLPVDYFGNAVSGIFAVQPLSNFGKRNFISEAIKEVQETKELDGTGLSLHLTTLVIEDQMKRFGIGPPVDLLGYDILFNSWEHLYSSTEDLNLGIGQFCTMRFLMDTPVSPSYIFTLPSYGRRSMSADNGHSGQYPGGMELQVNLLADQMLLLEKDEEWLKYATVV
ncbi:hypothetical protein ACHAQJ_001630 [Trichoderma viride]